MDKEIWKDVKGYEGYYQVSNLGGVKTVSRVRCDKNYILQQITRKTHIGQNGYWAVSLFRDGIEKRFSVHRLVAEAFIPNPFKKPIVNHIDSNRANCNVENLEWVNQSENLVHAAKQPGYRNAMTGMMGKLSPQASPVIQSDLNGNVIKIWDSRVDAHRQLNINLSSISSCTTGRRKTAGGYKWESVVQNTPAAVWHRKN